MAKRRVLGINLFFDNSNNSGIVNYVYNIVFALNTLPVDKKPQIVLFYTFNAPIKQIKEIGYDFINFKLFDHYPKNNFVRKANSLLFRITKFNLYTWLYYYRYVDILYPYFDFLDKPFINVKNKVHWLVDFNNKVFPHHYADNANVINKFQEQLTKKSDPLVLSSDSLLKELKFYYPHYKNQIFILKFACAIPDLRMVDAVSVLKRHAIVGKFVMSPNQFWEHKNQLIVLQALKILRDQNNLDFTLIFTGSMVVNRGKGHILEELTKYVEVNELGSVVKFLGVIERNEQLILMKNSTALLQPSLYEGWSTLVEEAKALNKRIVLSDLLVHKEQSCKNSYFFNPLSAVQLAEQLIKVSKEKSVVITDNYDQKIKDYGIEIYNMIEKIIEPSIYSKFFSK